MSKIILFDVRILGLSIVLAIANILIYGQNEDLLFSVLLGVVLFLAIWFFWILINVLIVLTTPIKKAPNEKNQLVELTSMTPDENAPTKNGLVVLTNQKLHFKTYFFTRQKEYLAYDLRDIKNVAIQYKGFIERYQMEVVMRSQATYIFNVYSGKHWHRTLRAQHIRASYNR